MRNWKVGEKINTVFNYPVLLDGTQPMHVLLEVTDVVQVEGEKVPKTRAIALNPIDDQRRIVQLLRNHRDFPPNYIRLRLKELEDERLALMEALNEFNTNLIDVGAEARQRLARIEQQRYGSSTTRRKQ